MRFRVRVHFVLAAIALQLTAAANAADVVFDNGASNQDDGWEMTQFVEADDFVLHERTSVSGVKFWNYARTGYFTGTVTWQIHANTSTKSPGPVLASGTSSGLTHAFTGNDLFDFLFEAVTTFQITPVVLDPGTYWLALHNGPLNYVTRGMFWAPTGKKQSAGTPSQSRDALGAAWYSNDYPGMSPDLAFQVFGTVVPGVLGTGFVNGTPVVNFASKLGKQYRLEYKNNLSETWRAVPGREIINGTGGNVQANDPQADARTAARRFYRVVVL